MKILVNISRILIGLLFIISGFVKLNDPTGFSYKLDEYFTVFADDVAAQQDSMVTTFTINNVTEEHITHFTKRSKQIAFVVNQSPVTTVASNEDTAYTSKLEVLQNGNSVFTQDIFLQKLDSTWTSEKVQITCQINENTALDKSALLSNPAAETTTYDLDVSSYVKAETWAESLFNWMRNYALFFAVFMSWLEAILGFALLIGWQSKFTNWMLALLTIFFGFLTLYSWMYNKVTDCGCFGDAIPMNPEESFYKNVVIGLFILVLFYGRKHIKPIFSNSFAVKVLTVLTLILVGFSMYCKHYLPVIDFLHYSEGTDILEGMSVPEGMRASDHIQTTYLYKAKDGSGETAEVLYDSDKNTFEPKLDYTKWAFDKVVGETILEEAYTPPIHDFAFYDETQSNNYIDDFWLEENKLLLVIHDVKTTNVEAMKKINEIAEAWTKDGYEFWALTASPKEDVEKFRHDNQISAYTFYYGDNTNLKSIVRSSPGLLLITDTSVVAKVWPSTRLPKYKKIVKQLK